MGLSYTARRPPTLSGVLIPNKFEDGFGQVTDYGADDEETLHRRNYVSAKTPGWKTMKKRDLPLHNYLAMSSVRTDKGGTAEEEFLHWDGYSWIPRIRRWEGQAEKFFPSAWDVMDWLVSYNSEPMIEASQQKALAKCAGIKVNVAQSFAERKQTANLLIHNVNRLTTFALLIRRGKFTSARRMMRDRHAMDFDTGGGLMKLPTGRSLRHDTKEVPSWKDFPNLWLEYSYGWRPLVADIYGSAELLAQLATKSRPLYVSGVGLDLDRGKDSNNAYGVNTVAESKTYCRAKTKLWFDVDDSVSDALKYTGLANPALLAWELIPYSFVVDWVYPVGQYLQNWNAASGLKFVKGMTTCKTEIDINSRVISNDHGYRMSGFNCSEKTVVMDRRILTEFPSARLPRFEMGLNLSQVTSALSLLSQIFNGSGPKGIIRR